MPDIFVFCYMDPKQLIRQNWKYYLVFVVEKIFFAGKSNNSCLRVEDKSEDSQKIWNGIFVMISLLSYLIYILKKLNRFCQTRSGNREIGIPGKGSYAWILLKSYSMLRELTICCEFAAYRNVPLLSVSRFILIYVCVGEKPQKFADNLFSTATNQRRQKKPGPTVTAIAEGNFVCLSSLSFFCLPNIEVHFAHIKRWLTIIIHRDELCRKSQPKKKWNTFCSNNTLLWQSLRSQSRKNFFHFVLL